TPTSNTRHPSSKHARKLYHEDTRTGGTINSTKKTTRDNSMIDNETPKPVEPYQDPSSTKHHTRHQRRRYSRFQGISPTTTMSTMKVFQIPTGNDGTNDV
ncbi:21316_t:CDS:2, partial [Dentiscutata erythropus]